MRKLLATTALGLLIATPALAENHVVTIDESAVPATTIVLVAPVDYEVEGYAPYEYDFEMGMAEGYADLEDTPVYSSITGEEIGEIESVKNGANGMASFVELEIGGFLDIGDKEILLPIDQGTFYRGEDGYRFYVAATEEQLEEYPTWDD